MPTSEKRPQTSRGREIMAILARHHAERGMTPEKLRLILEDLGPTFVKLGQILSMRTDILPVAYCRELEKLRADVPPMPMEDVRAVILEGTGKAPDELFAAFDEAPVGSASIAQAHTATLKDGTRVVVKVQRRNIHRIMREDLTLLRRAAGVIRLTGLDRTVDFSMVLDEMEQVTEEEMDFRREADNLREFARENAGIPCIACPRVFDEISCETLLCMEYVDGFSLKDPAVLTREGYDLRDIGDKLAENYVHQIVDTGFFHADPHPGNIRIRGGQIVWLDMGMMGRLSQRDRELLRSGVQAVSAHDVEMLRRIVMAMGKLTGPVDGMALTCDIDDFLTRYESMALGTLDLGAFMKDLMDLAQKHHIAMPSGMTMLARGVVTIEGVLRQISPETSIMAVVTHHMSDSLLKQIDPRKEAVQFIGDAHASLSKAARLPSQLSDMMRTFNKGQARVSVEVRAREGVGVTDRMMRRLILALMASACILSGALMALSPTLSLWWTCALLAVGAGLGVCAAWK